MWLINQETIINLDNVVKIIVGPASLLVFFSADKDNYVEVKIEPTFDIIDSPKQFKTYVSETITKNRTA